MHEYLVKRTVWMAKCKCGALEDVRTENPPRERQCKECGEWAPFVEQSAVGPDLRKARPND